MKLPIICRTCDCTETDHFQLLTASSETYPEKQLSDILSEITGINLNATANLKLPQSLCSWCIKKLMDSYCYVKQAQAANVLLMKLLKNGAPASAGPKSSHCLQEAPMELCAEQHVEIKLEIEDNDANIMGSDWLKPGDPEVDSKKSIDPLKMIDSTKLEEDESSVVNPAKKEEDEDSLDNLPLEGRMTVFKCKDCPRKFKRPEYVERHATLVHRAKVSRNSKRSANLCEQKMAKAVDINLCKPHGYKLIKCIICQSQYDKIADLRRHLEEHPDIISLGVGQHVKPIEMSELFYPDSKNLGEEQLINMIQKDLAAGIYQRFYSITNQSGYEMDLDSSETESDLDGEPEDSQKRRKKSRKPSYTCELCQQKFPRKYLLYDHQRQSHSWTEAPHVCGRCDGRFVSLQLLRHHNESQCRNAQKRFRCRKCPLRFRWEDNLKAHLREHKITNEMFECPECQRVFGNKKSLTVHLLSDHAESELMPCQWCSRKFYRHDYLVKHLKRHGLKEQDIPLAETLTAATSRPNGIKRISCRMCNLHFERISDLRTHIQEQLKLSLLQHQSYDFHHNYSITNESGFELQLEDSETEDEMQSGLNSRPLYVCELCNVKCKRKYEIIQHQQTMHRFHKMPHECDNCIFKCVSKVGLNGVKTYPFKKPKRSFQSIMQHHRLGQCSSSEKKHICGKCSYKFMWPENLEQHMRLQHSDSAIGNASGGRRSNGPGYPDKDATENGVPLLQCPHCDRTYQMKSRLNNHIRDVHVNVNGARKRKVKEKKRFLCSLCGIETPTPAALVTHMRRHTGEKPFQCDQCTMAYPRHSELVSHRRIHTGEKPFHCTVCGKDFARSDKLKCHMLTHSGLKPHKCTYCEKSYRQAKDLKVHLQQHTGKCPFVCGTCGERFIQSGTLEKHRQMRRHFEED
ncbi:hypothetical protein KR009_003302 [Drosophila setifemur]|nr:hypothetical protein KR009_003302 [Drosophila setifemur]